MLPTGIELTGLCKQCILDQTALLDQGPHYLIICSSIKYAWTSLARLDLNEKYQQIKKTIETITEIS